MAGRYATLAAAAAEAGGARELPGREQGLPLALDCEAATGPGPMQHRRWRAGLVPLLAAATLAGVVALAAAGQGRRAAAALGADEMQRGVRDGLVALAAFDCGAGYENFQRGWSDEKKRWCCSFKDTGCPGEQARGLIDDAFDCAAGLADWEAGWSVQKKIWCCSNKELGCPEVTHVSVTFTVANMVYKTLLATGLTLQEFEAVIKKVIVAQVMNDVRLGDIVLQYWAGSGLEATAGGEENTGVVVRARITVPDPQYVTAVREALSHAAFPLKIATAVAHIGGIGEVLLDRLKVHDVTVEMPIVALCTCSDGNAAVRSTECPKYGGEVCHSCFPGYHLTSGLWCMENICMCQNGVPAQGDLCAAHATTKCASCLVGFHLEAGSCKPNVCRCDEGIGATGPACGMHLGLICSSCQPGFHVDAQTKTCAQSTCFCAEGVPATGVACVEDEAYICTSCQDGYHVSVDETQCLPNRCKCSKGVAALGPLCHTNGGEVCAYCNAGENLHKNGVCGDPVCLCPNGTAVTGDRCTLHHATICSSCNAGFSEILGQCVETPCGCKNGNPLGMEACTIPGMSICAECHQGFHLVGSKCLPNKCTCDHGLSAVGKQCAVDGGHACGSCDVGFRHALETVTDQSGTNLAMTCVENTCQCLDGTKEVGEKATGVTKPRCHADMTNVCVSCIGGYHLNPGHQCVRNQCGCSDGVAVDAADCSVNGTENCTSCNDGFFLARQPPLTIQQGYEAPSAARFANGAKICVAKRMTTSAPFDCQVALHNWEQDWSDMKKHWCCENRNLGCKPTGTGVELCEGQGFNKQQCGMVGCCQFDAVKQQCLSLVGKRVCFPEFNIKSSEGYCVEGVKQLNAYSPGKEVLVIVRLENCNLAEKRQEWRPSLSGQIENAVGECLRVTEMTAGAQVISASCKKTNPPDERELLVYDRATQLFMVGSGMPKNLCLTTRYGGRVDDLSLKATTCNAADLNQMWAVPQVAEPA